MKFWRSYGVFVPVLVLLALFGAYTGYWFYVAGQVETAIAIFKETPENGAPEFDYANLEITGFPFRIEVIADKARITAPDLEFFAERIDANLLPYDLNHVVLQSIGRVDLNIMRRDENDRPAPLAVTGAAKSFLASYIADGDGPARLDIALNGFSGALTDADNPPVTLSVANAELHLRRAPDDANSSDLVAKLETLELGPGIEPVLGRMLDRVLLDARLEALPLAAMQSGDYVRLWAASGGRANIANGQLVWGGVDIQATGIFALDAERRLNGDMDASIAGYATLLDRLYAAGRIDKNARSLLTDTLGILARLGGGRAGIPIKFDQGRVLLGPVAIGELRPLF